MVRVKWLVSLRVLRYSVLCYERTLTSLKTATLTIFMLSFIFAIKLAVSFLVGCSWLYKRVCQSVGWSVCMKHEQAKNGRSSALVLVQLMWWLWWWWYNDVFLSYSDSSLKKINDLNVNNTFNNIFQSTQCIDNRQASYGDMVTEVVYKLARPRFFLQVSQIPHG